MLKIRFYYFKNNRENPKIRLQFEQKFQINMSHWRLLIAVLDKHNSQAEKLSPNIYDYRYRYLFI